MKSNDDNSKGLGCMIGSIALLILAIFLLMGILLSCSGRIVPGNDSKYSHFGSKHRVEQMKDSATKK